MVSVLTRKGVALASVYNQRFLSRTFSFCFKSFMTIHDKDDGVVTHSVPASDYSSSLHLSPLFSSFNHPSNGYDIKVVDHHAWWVSSGVALAWQGRDWTASGASSLGKEVTDEAVGCHSSHVEGELDFEDIDNMRIRGSLFYKLERSSKEFEEYNLELHRKKSSKKKDDKKENIKEVKKAKTSPNVNSKDENVPKVHEVTSSKNVVAQLDEINDTSVVSKRQRTPTFNQLTGAILARRALADDIHDVIYTPRKGERLEGKLAIVLRSIIDNGINVKVKIKRRPKKSIRSHPT